METQQCVKDLMVPIDEYPFVSIDATLLDVVTVLQESQAQSPSDREPDRAVLVRDHQNLIVGKIGYLDFLKALEPRLNIVGKRDTLTHAGLGPEFLEWMIDNLRFWQEDFSLLCRRAQSTPVSEILQPVQESIKAEASLCEAINRFVVMQSLSLLVSSGTEIVGILRLSDLFHTIANTIQNIPYPAE